MKYILILYATAAFAAPKVGIPAGPYHIAGMTSAAFDDKEACEAALKAMEAASGAFITPGGYATGVFGKCFPSGTEKK